MEQQSSRRSVPSLESEYERLKKSGHYIDDDNKEQWIQFWQMCERNDKNLKGMMTKS